MRLKCDGKQFVAGDERFMFRGVTYGTFAPREDGHRYPDLRQVKTDLAAVRDAGFSVVRTYRPIRRAGRAVILPAQGARPDLVSGIVADLRRAGLRVMPATGWEDHDARILGSWVVAGELVTSAYPEGCVQLRVRRRLRRGAALLAIAAVLSLYEPELTMAFGIVLAVEGGRGWWRTGPGLIRILREVAS